MTFSDPDIYRPATIYYLRSFILNAFEQGDENARFRTFLPNIICSEGLVFTSKCMHSKRNSTTLANFVQFGGKFGHLREEETSYLV